MGSVCLTVLNLLIPVDILPCVTEVYYQEAFDEAQRFIEQSVERMAS
jgi:hypothetical protein